MISDIRVKVIMFNIWVRVEVEVLNLFWVIGSVSDKQICFNMLWSLLLVSIEI